MRPDGAVALPVKPPDRGRSAVATHPPGEGVAPAGAHAAGAGAGGDTTGTTWMSLRFEDFSSVQSFGTCFGVS
jgi:hypothetical protein